MSEETVAPLAPVSQRLQRAVLRGATIALAMTTMLWAAWSGLNPAALADYAVFFGVLAVFLSSVTYVRGERRGPRPTELPRRGRF